MATESYIMGLSGATVTAGFHRLTTECEEAIIAAMKNIYWLANKRRQALLKYNSLNSLKKKKRLQIVCWWRILMLCSEFQLRDYP